MSHRRQWIRSTGDQGELEPEGAQGRIFLAEDDVAMRQLLVRAMTRAGFQVLAARSGLELLGRIETELGDGHDLGTASVIVSDVRMRSLGGLSVLETLREAGVDTPCILMSAFGDQELHTRAGELGAEELLDKPFEIETLLDRVRLVLDRQQKNELALLQGQLAQAAE